MSMHKDGSILVMTIIVTGVLSMLALGAWEHAMYLMEIATARAEYAQLQAASKGLMNLAIEVGVEHSEAIQKNSREYAFDIHDWFKKQETVYVGCVRIMPEKNSMLVRCWLEHSAIKKCAMQCVLVQKEDHYQTREWSFE